QEQKLTHIVLGIAVGIKDELLARFAKTGAQRAAVAAVPLMMDDADLREAALEKSEDLLGLLLAAVIDEDHLIIVGDLFGRCDGLRGHGSDGAPVVVD